MTPTSGSGSAADRQATARHTLDRVNEGLQSGKTAGIAEIIQLVHALSANALDISVQELAELIEKDVTVTAKVLSAANQLGYNPAAQHVTTISEAIQTIGFNKVRMLAMSLMLMETAERTQSDAERREASMLAVTSGIVAQAWAEQSGRGNAEQAFVCASLRNFGKLILTTFLMEDYRRAQDLAGNLGDGDAAYRAVLGLTPLELGYELLKSANLPPPLLQTLRTFNPKMLETAVLDPQTELLVAAEFSVRLCELSMNANISPENYQREIEALCGRFQKHLGVTKELVGEFLERAHTKMASFGHAFGMAELGREVGQRFEARREGRMLAPRAATPPPPVDAATPAGPASAASAAGTPAGARPPGAAPESLPAGAKEPSAVAGDALLDPAATAGADPGGGVKRELGEVLQETIARVGEMIARPDLKPEDVAQAVTDALRLGWEADEVVVLLERGKGSYAVLAGSGERWRNAKLKMSFKREERNVLGVAVTRCEPVLIHDATDPKIAPYLPPWLRGGLELVACAIVPGGDEKSSHSVVFGGWRVKRKVHLTASETRSIRALLGLVVTARRLSGG